MRLIRYLLAALLIAATAHGQQLLMASIGGGVTPADGQTRTVTYTNTTGVTQYIKRIQLFMGVGGIGTQCDFCAYVQQASSGNLLIFRGWDHYAAATTANANNPEEVFSPCFCALPPGDSLNENSFAIVYGPIPPGTKGAPAYTIQVTGWFWWTTTP